MRRRRRLVLIGIGALAALLALELVLQVVAFVVWSSREGSTPPPAGDGSRAVLCVGDSFTWGLGARDRENAYPAVAQRALAARASTTVRFVNLGWPGQDSGRVLRRLNGQLERYRPTLVYVLVGYNDFWRDDPGAADPDAFPRELRTWKLLRMIKTAVFGGGPPAPARIVDPTSSQALADAPFLGAWRAGPVFFDFRADGTIDTSDGPFDGVWSLRQTRLVLELRDQEAQVEIDWHIDGDQLVLEGGPFGSALTLQRGLPDATAFDRGRNAARAGDSAAAEREWRAALDDPARGFDARIGLVRLLAEQARIGDARALLGPAIDIDDRSPRPARATAIVEALVAIGDLDRAFERIGGVLRERRFDDAFVQVVIRNALSAPDPSRFDADLLAALDRDDLTAEHRIAMLGLRARVGVDADATLESLLELARLRPDADAFVRTVRSNGETCPRDEFVTRAQRLPEAERAAVVAAFDRARATEDHTADVLERNARAIVAACRAAGAEPVLMTYPGSRQDIAAVINSVAVTAGAGLIDHFEAFADLLRTMPRAELFVSDGHCNDAGYERMGEAVAADAARRLR